MFPVPFYPPVSLSNFLPRPLGFDFFVWRERKNQHNKEHNTKKTQRTLHLLWYLCQEASPGLFHLLCFVFQINLQFVVIFDTQHIYLGKKKSLRFYFPCGFLFMSSPDLTWHRVIVCSAPPFCFEGVH